MSFREVLIALVILEVDLVSVSDVVRVVGQTRSAPHELEVQLSLEIVKAFEYCPEALDALMLLCATLRTTNDKSRDLRCTE